MPVTGMKLASADARALFVYTRTIWRAGLLRGERYAAPEGPRRRASFCRVPHVIAAPSRVGDGCRLREGDPPFTVVLDHDVAQAALCREFLRSVSPV
jgi:hypothetical protein